MNITQYPVVDFKEFEGYQPQTPFQSAPVSNWLSNDGNNFRDIVEAATSSFKNQHQGLKDGFQERPSFENSRMLGNRFPGSHSRAKYRQTFSPLRSEPTAPSYATSMTLNERSFRSNLQSTELTIQTKDGDTVTIRIRERSIEKEQSEVSVAAGNREAGSRTDIDQASRSSSSEAVGLSAILTEETVSDVQYQRELSERSEDSVNVHHSADGVSADVAYRSKSYTAGALEFEVDGSLDADELEAIGALVKGVDELSQTFFDGNVVEAFKQAQAIGYDESEIAGYALELKEREFNYAEQQYRATEAMQKPDMPVGLFRSIGNYADSLNTLEELDRGQFGGQLLETLMKRVDENRGAEKERVEGSRDSVSFQRFNLKLLQQVQALQVNIAL